MENSTLEDLWDQLESGLSGFTILGGDRDTVHVRARGEGGAQYSVRVDEITEGSSGISADIYVRVDCDGNGRRRIQSAIDTMREITDAVASCSTCDCCANLRAAVKDLEGILDGRCY